MFIRKILVALIAGIAVLNLTGCIGMQFYSDTINQVKEIDGKKLEETLNDEDVNWDSMKAFLSELKPVVMP